MIKVIQSNKILIDDNGQEWELIKTHPFNQKK